MRPWLLPILAIVSIALTLVACDEGGPQHIAQFWRPISEPNLEMPLDKAQRKLDFDTTQCHCGIFPANTTHSEASEFQPDKQRLAQTSVTVTPNDKGQCIEQPSLVVTECMRARGWEPTNCSGRLPIPNGGSLCTAYVYSGNP